MHLLVRVWGGGGVIVTSSPFFVPSATGNDPINVTHMAGVTGVSELTHKQYDFESYRILSYSLD